MANNSKSNRLAKVLTGIGLSVAVAMSSLPANAIDLFVSVGANGEPRYTQLPPRDADKYEVISMRSDGRKENAGNMAGKTNTPQAKQLTDTEKQAKAVEERIKKQEEMDKAKRCQSLRNNLTNLNIGGKIYEKDKDGKKTYLDQRQIDQKKDKIRQALGQYCADQTA